MQRNASAPAVCQPQTPWSPCILHPSWWDARQNRRWRSIGPQRSTFASAIGSMESRRRRRLNFCISYHLETIAFAQHSFSTDASLLAIGNLSSASKPGKTVSCRADQPVILDTQQAPHENLRLNRWDVFSEHGLQNKTVSWPCIHHDHGRWGKISTIRSNFAYTYYHLEKLV